MLAGVLAVSAILAVVLLSTSAGGSGGGYTVRAIFDDAGNLIPGEDAKIDGVKVGIVKSVTATPTAKAAVVIEIEDPGFQDFRQDASCTLRPQALIGEKYVDCLPTQPRVEGMPLRRRCTSFSTTNQEPTKARASTTCRSPTHRALLISISCRTSRACPRPSGCGSSSTNSVQASPGGAAISGKWSVERTRRCVNSTRS